MRVFKTASILLAFILTVLVTHAAELATSDGLKLRFAADGVIEAVSDGKNGVASQKPGGIYVRGAGAKSLVLMHGALLRENGSLHLYSTSQSLNLEVTAEFQNRGDYISIEGVVKNPSGKERCVDLRVVLPVDASGWRWGSGLKGEQVINAKAEGAKTADKVTIYPLAPISSTNANTGFCLAVPPNHPTLFDTGADAEGLYIEFKIGLSPETVPANETKFRAIAFRHDPRWGFRAALDRYYTFFREPYFSRRVKKIGAWAWHNPPPATLYNSDLYAFHEAGGEIWKTKDEGMHGYEHEGVNLAKDVEDMERLGQFKRDDELGIYSLPYTIVGQRQVYRLPSLPKTREEAIAAFEKWTTDKPIVFQCPGPSVGFRSVEQLKDVIRASCIYDENQKPVVMSRQYLGNTVTFPLNPSPNLFNDSKVMTIARYTMDDYLPMLFTGSKSIDGCYVDSLGRWCSYNNFRREHFKYSTVPLTYGVSKKVEGSADDADEPPPASFAEAEDQQRAPQPCLWSLQSHAEYLWQLSRYLHAQNKIVFANGVHPNRVMLGFAVDVLGSESMPSYRGGEGFYSSRVAAYQKPFCALNGRDSTSPAAWNSCLFLGILAGSRSEAGQKLERKYLPTMIRINEAGWEPITYARAENAAVGVERWGRGGKLYFTVMNGSKQPVETRLQLDSRALGLGKHLKVRDLIADEPLECEGGKDSAFIKLNLAAEQTVAIGFN